MLSPLYGLAADHALEFEAVTTTGTFVKASPTVNPDLFWALRGGVGEVSGASTSGRGRVAIAMSPCSGTVSVREWPKPVDVLVTGKGYRSKSMSLQYSMRQGTH